jgi:hypothetical protein
MIHMNVSVCPCIECQYWRGESAKAIEVVEKCTCDEGDVYICVDGTIYGPCEYFEECNGGCEYFDECTCHCHRP